MNAWPKFFLVTVPSTIALGLLTHYVFKPLVDKIIASVSKRYKAKLEREELDFIILLNVLTVDPDELILYRLDRDHVASAGNFTLLAATLVLLFALAVSLFTESLPSMRVAGKIISVFCSIAAGVLLFTSTLIFLRTSRMSMNISEVMRQRFLSLIPRYKRKAAEMSAEERKVLVARKASPKRARKRKA